MPPWTVPWDGWAMPDSFPLFRGGSPQAHGLRYRFEKAGVTLEDQPIPWGADAVLIEATALLSSAFASRLARDFPLHLDGGHPPYFPESLSPLPRGGLRLLYRLPVPRQTGMVEVFYRHRSLGQLALPILTAAEFTRRLQLDMPTVAVCMNGASVACQSYVGTQCQGLVAAGVLRHAQGSLLPLLDLGMRVELAGPRGENTVIPLHFTAAQLANKQALATAVLPRARRLGEWQVAWRMGDHLLARQEIRAVSKPQFLRSLRVRSTRFLVMAPEGTATLMSSLPKCLDEVRRAGPCFLLESAVAGMAGQVPLRVVARVRGALQPPVLEERDFLLSDGPNPILPGTLDAADLDQVDAFELHGPRGLLGKLPLKIPQAVIDAEGAFRPGEEFTWGEAAEEELWEKLAGLSAKKS